MLRGLWTTFREMFTKPVTIQYPETKRPVRTRFKGRHELKRYDNGLEKCIGCALCAAACPADAIFVEASENTDDERYSPGERYASTYEINYELSFTDRADAIYTKDMLIVKVPAGGQSTPQKVAPGSFDRSIPEMKDPTD